MSELAPSVVVWANPVPWHVGISPAFPGSLLLSDDAAIETLLTDIPFLSVGLLGFGVLTFFIAMRKFNRISLFVFLSVIVAFIAGVLDVGQVLIRGRAATDSDTNVSSILAFLIARELLLAISIGIRFLFFWSFVSLPPRGERPLLSRVDTKEQEQRPNFLRLESDSQSGSWRRWGIIGMVLKVTILAAVLAITILQLIWRLDGRFNNPGAIYNTDAILEIVVSALFILKLFANAWLSALTPRWKTIRDYSPIIFALLIALGVAIGNIVFFEFSETSLGRLLQAVELYALVLYVLISGFYSQRRRMSMVDTKLDRESKILSPSSSTEGTGDATSTFQITPATTSPPANATNNIISRKYTPSKRPSNRLSSWLISNEDPIPSILSSPRRMSTRITSWMMTKTSGKKDALQTRLWTKDDVESGTSPIDQKTGFSTFSDASSPEARDAVSFRDREYAPPLSSSASQRLGRITNALSASSPLKLKIGTRTPDSTSVPIFVALESNEDLIPPRRLASTIPGSPVYGIDGIVGYYGQPSPSVRDSTRSSGMESLLRQQAELDKSVAELQLFSPAAKSSPTSLGGRTRLAIPGGQPESFRSEFSLSNFPEPPSTPPLGPNTGGMLEATRGEIQKPQEGTSTVTGVPIVARPQRVLELNGQTRRRQSFPSATRSSSDSTVLGAANRSILNSGGTQYDVTSFIGDLTTPATKDISDKPRRPVSLVVEQPNKDAQTIQLKPGLQAQVLPVTMANGNGSANSQINPSPSRKTKQGLPDRAKLNISAPIRRTSVDRSMAYERPRAVPAA